MEFEELKHTWHQQKINEDLDYSREELLMLLNNKVVSFEEQIKSRDRREIIAVIIVVVLFSIFFFMTPSAWQKVASAIIILSGFFIWYKLKTAQRKRLANEPEFDHSLYDHLYNELKWLKKQKNMIEQVAWWYILPIALGLIVFAMGFEWIIFKFAYIGVVILIGVVIWRLNQRVVKKKFNPLIDELQEAISAIEDSK